MTSSTIRRTGFQSSLSLSPQDMSDIFCCSFHGGVTWTRKKCNCISCNLKITFFYLLEGSILKYRHLAILIVNCFDRGELFFHNYFFNLTNFFGQTLLLRTLEICDNNLLPSVVSLTVLVTSSSVSSIRSPYLCSEHLITSWIIHDMPLLNTPCRVLCFSMLLLNSDVDRRYLTKHLLVLAFVQKSFQDLKIRFFLI